MKKMILVLMMMAASVYAIACTTFFINKNGQLVFGRNYDWVTGNGMVCTNQKGLYKISSPTSDGATINWISKYGSITFNQYGKEFPTGGMNETGLVVEQMWLDGTQYPAPDKRPAIGELQWIQYQLDNCSTVNELIKTDKVLRIATKGTAPLHFLVADAKGNAATIEFMDGKMQVHKGKQLPFPVLTNSSYASVTALTKTAISGTDIKPRAFNDNSAERFATACSMVKQLMETNTTVPVIDYSFSLLSKVAQGTHTKWSIVYDISQRTVYFKTSAYQEIKSLSFQGLDLQCSALSNTWNMNQAGSGNIFPLMVPFSAAINRQLVEKSFAESSSEISATAKEIENTWQYPIGISCQIAEINNK